MTPIIVLLRFTIIVRACRVGRIQDFEGSMQGRNFRIRWVQGAFARLWKAGFYVISPVGVEIAADAGMLWRFSGVASGALATSHRQANGY
jgi:hypothetical protein